MCRFAWRKLARRDTMTIYWGRFDQLKAALVFLEIGPSERVIALLAMRNIGVSCQK